MLSYLGYGKKKVYILDVLWRNQEQNLLFRRGTDDAIQFYLLFF